MKKRKVTQIVRGRNTVDGAGVHLRRILGEQTVHDFDPFLMLDGFDSTNPQDYIKGFPWHPHRGIETVTYLVSGTMKHEDKLTRELGRTYGFDMTFHKARHNFGTHITLSLGVPIETVSRMMGHKSISTTQIYAKVTDRKVDEDMKRLKEQTKGRKINLYEEDEPETADIITVNG